MKKLLLIMAGLCLLLVGIWLGAVWWTGLQTEQQVRQYFEQTGTQHELVSYRRSFFGATALTRHPVSQTLLGNWFNELLLEHRITHGPLNFLSKSQPLQTGWSFWQTRLAVDALDEEPRQFLQDTFNAQPPLLGTVHVDLERTAHYKLELAPLSLESPIDELIISLGGLQLEGQYHPADPKTFFTVTLQQTVLENRDIRLQLPGVLIRWLAENENNQPQAEQRTELRWNAEQISAFFTNVSEPIRFNASGEIHTQTAARQLSGIIRLHLDQFSGLGYPLQQVEFRVDYAGLHAAATAEIDRLQNRMQDLQAQLDWQAGDVELPEGRRQLFQLDVQLEETADQLLQVLFKQALQPEHSQLNTRIRLSTVQGDVAGEAALRYAGMRQPFTFKQLTQADLADWLPLLRGDIELTLAKAAVPDDLELFLFYPAQQQGLIEAEDSYWMQLRLLEKDTALNGRVVAYQDLAEHFWPSVTAADAVPEDIWSLVETQGFSEELLQQLEQRADITPATLQLLRELQQMSQ